MPTNLTTVRRKVAQRGLVAVVIMLPLILVSNSLADAQAQIVNIPCGRDIDATINNTNLYPRSTPQRFVLAGNCTYPVSQTMNFQNGDEIVCPPGVVQARPVSGTYPSGIKTTLQAASGLATIAHPYGYFYTEWCRWTGADFKGSNGTGVAIVGGQMADTSVIYATLFDHNEANAINNARGTLIDVEAAFNGSSAALGFISGGIKGARMYEVDGGYIHNNIGNGIWCDSGCDAISEHPNGYWVHGAETSGNSRSGIRYENSATEALIEQNHVYGNTSNGISVRDAGNALIQNNIFAGSGFAHNDAIDAPKYTAIRASDSGKAGRAALTYVRVVGNDLNGETIRGCELPDNIVLCSQNTP